VLTLDPSTFVDAVKHLILPAIALGTIPLAIITRITRAAVLEVIDDDYVRTAEAKGMTAAVVNIRHVLRNAMLPIVTIIGLQTGLLLSGAVLTEVVFAWGGMGSYLYQAIIDRDFPVIEGGVLFLAVVFVAVNLLVDLVYGLLDPRIRVA
jgi:peptide/nickel transport system permease protein